MWKYMLDYETTQGTPTVFLIFAHLLLKHNLLSLHSNIILKPCRGRIHLDKAEHTETQTQQTEKWINRKRTTIWGWPTGEYWLGKMFDYWLKAKIRAERQSVARKSYLCYKWKRHAKRELTGSCFAIGLRRAESREWWEQVGRCFFTSRCLLSHGAVVRAWWYHRKHIYSPLSLFPSPLLSIQLRVCHWPSSKQRQVSFVTPSLTPPTSSLYYSLNFHSSSHREVCVQPTWQTSFKAGRDCFSLFHSEKLNYISNDTSWFIKTLNQKNLLFTDF